MPTPRFAPRSKNAWWQSIKRYRWLEPWAIGSGLKPPRLDD